MTAKGVNPHLLEKIAATAVPAALAVVQVELGAVVQVALEAVVQVDLEAVVQVAVVAVNNLKQKNI
jgi:tRNA-binding EMAP/Myf-like protein